MVKLLVQIPAAVSFNFLVLSDNINVSACTKKGEVLVGCKVQICWNIFLFYNACRVYCYFFAYKPLQNGHIDILFIVLQGSAHHEKHTFAIFLGVNPDQTYLNQAFLNSVSVNSLSIIFSNLYFQLLLISAIHNRIYKIESKPRMT